MWWIYGSSWIYLDFRGVMFLRSIVYVSGVSGSSGLSLFSRDIYAGVVDVMDR